MGQGSGVADRSRVAVSQDEAIAVVGIGCWYPGAKGAMQLWENVVGRRREFRRFPDMRLPVGEYFDPDRSVPDKLYVDRAAFIDGFEFDWATRRIPKSAYESTDIVQWLAVEVAEQALVDAGYQRGSVPKHRTGVIVGNSLTGEQSRANTMRLRWPYVAKVLKKVAGSLRIPPSELSRLVSEMETVYKSAFPPVTEDTLQGGLSNTIAGRVCNYFDLHGGGYVVDGACSSSLLAVCTAASYLVSGDLDVALAGGVDVSLDTFELIGFAKTGALAANEAGDINVYDRKGAGFLPGEGCGFVVLKRLADARAAGDTVYAVIKGWGISSDGKGGITAPSRDGQALALSRAYQRAQYSPHSLDFIEGHGTGTAVGDRTELEGIAKAMAGFGAAAPRSCGVTSFKSIVGHTKAAAGIGAFIKAAIAVNRRVLPPTAGYQEPNPVFENGAQALFPVKYGAVYDPKKIVRAGVSAMGFGGINSHVTLESGDHPSAKFAPEIDERTLLANAQDCEVFVAGADSLDELLIHVKALEAEVGELSVGDLTDLAARLGKQCPRAPAARAAVIASTPAELKARLKVLREQLSMASSRPDIANAQDKIWWGINNTAPRIGFLFPGQGSQQLAMGRVLVERYPWARRMVEATDRAAEELLGKPISPLLYGDLDRTVVAGERQERTQVLADTAIAQPAICLASLLYARYLNELGLTPHLVGGHSLGELTAFQSAGAYSEEVLIRLALIRGRAMAEASDGNGSAAMASLACDATRAESILRAVTDGYVVIANINAPNQTVISGEADAVGRVIQLGERAGVSSTRLRVSGAFHSRLVESAASRLSAEAEVPDTLDMLNCLLLSGTDGGLVSPGLDLKSHFSAQLLSQVNFSWLVANAAKECDLLVEVGPGRILSGLVARNIDTARIVCLPVASDPDSMRDLNASLAQAFVRGVEVRWEALYDRRLVRPYKSASQRIFLDNPCERPTTEVPELSAAEKSTVDAYAVRRAPVSIEQLAVAERPVPNYGTQRIEGDAGEAPDMDRQPDSSRDASRWLVELVSERTGFPAASISMEARLLDDLNLDSIKAGELVASAAAKVGVSGQVDPSALANSSVADIVAALNTALRTAGGSVKEDTRNVDTHEPSPAQQSAVVTSHEARQKEAAGIAPESENIGEILLAMVVDRTGYPRSSVSLELRLLDDLNLDSIKAGELVSAAVARLGVSGVPDPIALANARLSEIAKAIAVAKGETVPFSEAAPDIRTEMVASPDEREDAASTGIDVDDSWVREFAMKPVTEPLTNDQTPHGWSGARLVVIGMDAYRELSQATQTYFERIGARTEYVDFSDLNSRKASLTTGATHLLVLLPTHPGVHGGELAEISRAVERLTAVVDVLSATGAGTLLVAQFAGGRFGQGPGDAVGVEVSGAMGFVSTLWLERPESVIRVVDLSPRLGAEVIPELLRGELESEGPFAVAGYDDKKQRYVLHAEPLHPVRYEDRKLSWTNRDVVLVTGGAKGITAECALAFAAQTGARFALVGSSSLDVESGANSEIQSNLDRFERLGVRCKYYSCDIADLDAVSRLVAQIKAELGSITAVVHGAGINRPRPATQVSAVEALKEVAPKLVGAVNLCKVLKHEPPKMFLAMSSIIGITGMRGNAWYAFSNEALDLALRRFAAACPEASVASLAYSVWGQVGMGHRLGVIKNLEETGVGAIPTEEGVKRFLRHMNADAGYRQVVIAGRLGGLPTWRLLRKSLGSFEDMRFVDTITDIEPGVEMTASCVLTLDRDLYLKDHNFHGSYLFPTVFGLEAMSQAASVLIGADASAIVGFESIGLERPIVVKEGAGTEVRLHAIADEESADGIRKVWVDVRVEQTGFKTNHFSATVVFGSPIPGWIEPLVSTESRLPLDPKRDLYGDGVLFQGPLFQRLESVYVLEDHHVVFSGESREGLFDGENGFAAGEGGSLLAGDPFFRDVLLQSVQLPVVPEVVLPIGIASIEIYNESDYENGNRVVTATLNSRDDRDLSWDVVVANEAGQVVEVLRDYRVRVLDGYKIGSTKISEIKTSGMTIPGMTISGSMTSKSGLEAIQQDVTAMIERLAGETPLVRLYEMPQLHSLRKNDRHELERPLIVETAHAWLEKHDLQPQLLDLTWTRSGKPCLVGEGIGEMDVSLSHDERLCLCVVGHGRQGCDIEPVSIRSRDGWRSLLGNNRMSLLEALARRGDSQEVAGTRIWCAIEAAKKAFAGADARIGLRSDGDGVVVFDAVLDDDTVAIVTGLFEGQSHRPRIVAVAMDNCSTAQQRQSLSAISDVSSADDNAFYLEAHASRMIRDPMLDQEIFEYVFQPTFKESANLSRTVFYTSYLAWIGKVRELFMAEIGRDLVAQITTGDWGLVTNWADVKIFSEVSAYDRVVARFRLGKLNGAVIPLYCDFYQLTDHGLGGLLARVEQETTWVEVVGHGLVRPAAFPSYFSAFLKRTQQSDNHRKVSTVSKSAFARADAAIDLYSGVGPAGNLPLLHSIGHSCTLEDANLVGNVYYANYFIWQGRVRDQFLFAQAPDYFRGNGSRGELLCIHSHLDYLRDAMPFDELSISMHLRSVSDVGAELEFEYHRLLQPGGFREKLAVGTQRVVWVLRDAAGKVVVSNFPDEVRAAFDQHIPRIGGEQRA